MSRHWKHVLTGPHFLWQVGQYFTLRKVLNLILLMAMVLSLFPVVQPPKRAEATHFRSTQLNWTHVSGTTAKFDSTLGLRRSYFSPLPNVGDTISPVTVYFGDGTSASPPHTVTSVDEANDWILAEAEFNHTYPAAGPYTAYANTCCRLSKPPHINNPDQNNRAETIVDFAKTSASPQSSITPIVDCPRDAICSFTVPATDPDGQALRFRFATSAEAVGGTVTFYQPGPPHAPNAATIDATTGTYTWNTTGAELATSGDTFYSTQVIVENLVGDTVVSKTAVDFFIRLAESSTNQAPVFTAPTPADGTTFYILVGETVSFNIAAGDPDAGDTVTLDVLGKPSDATFSTTSGNPASGTFSWTPTAAGDKLLTLTAKDQNGLGAPTRSVTISVGEPLKKETPPAETEENPPLLSGVTSLDPVHTLTGSFTYTYRDIAIAGRGPSPVFARTYNSNDTRVGPLGPGWTHNYYARLRDPDDGTGDVILVGPQGRSDRYTRKVDGTYAPPAGVYTTLSKNADNTYTATHKDQSTWTFSSGGNLIHIADPYANRATLSYNSSGQLTVIGDPAGRGSLSLSYDANARLISISDWLSPARVVQFGYDANGRLSTVTDRENKVTTYGYDGTSHRLTTITDANNHIAVTNTYDASGRVVTQKDARGLTTGQQTTFTYATNADGTKTTTVTYPATSFDSAWNPQVLDTYDDQGRIVERASKPTSDPNDNVVAQYAYDANSNLAAVTDGRGNTTNLCYDVDYAGVAISGNNGNMTRRIDPAPSSGENRPVTLYKYDSKNNLIQVIPPKGVNSGMTVTCATDLSASINLTYVTNLVYDTATQTKLESTIRKYVDPDTSQQVSAITKFEYTDTSNPGLVTKIIPPRGNTDANTPDYTYATTFMYFQSGTRAGLLESVTDALGNTTTYDYDAVGRRISMVDPLGNETGANPAEHTWEYSYDDEDRLRFTKAPAPSSGGSQLTTEFRYDAVGNRIAVLDANGQVTKYRYDERDSLQEVHESPNAWTDPAVEPSPKIVTAYQYDHEGNLSRVVRAKDDATYERAVDYVYDGLNRLRTETQYPDWPNATATLVTQYTYDANSNRQTLTDPLGQTTTFGYDALNRLTSIDFSDANTADVTYQYDAHGNRTEMATGTDLTTYSYDELDRLLSVTSPGPKTIGYRYDRDGNRTKVIYPDSTAVTYTFDQASRLESLLDWASRVTSYQYFPDGSLKQIANPNGTVADYTYDHARRLTEVRNQHGTNTITKHTYTLDNVGNRTQVDEVMPQIGSTGSETLWAWGANWNGQLGDGTTTNRATPVPVVGISEVIAVAGGGEHSLAIRSDGTVWAWGYNAYGQLGDGTTVTPRTTPVPTSNLNGVTAVSAGYAFSLALKSDGTVWAWGGNNSGKLGDGTRTDRTSPVQVSNLTDVSGIDAGWDHSLALKSDGTVWAWGFNGHGALGEGTNINARTTPVQVVGLSDVIGIAAGESHSLAVKGDGSVWAWGTNFSGELGDGTTTESNVPVQVQGLDGVIAVSAGESYSLALKGDGTVWAWGQNGNGRLGDGTTTNRATPVLVDGLTGVIAISAGGSLSLAIRNDHTVWVWGGGKLTPVQQGDLTNVSAVASGSGHSLLLTTVNQTPTVSITYDYDGLYRLTSVDDPTTLTSYAYDPVGNRLSMERDSNATTYTYDRADRIASAGTVSYTVDANGNLVARGSDTFAYDQANRLTSATIGGATSTYAYDGDGKRTSKTVGGTTTNYVYDVNASLPVVLDDGARKYVWGLGHVYSVDATSGSIQVSHTDGLGSVRAITDAAGTLVQTYETDEFGVATLTQGTSTQPFQYTGQQRDAETALLSLRARMYDPAIGRFLQRDPFPGVTTDPASQHPYSYARNNPTTLTDPSGEIAIVPILVGAYAVYEVASSVVDAVSTAQTLADPHASFKEKLLTSGLFVVGTFAPGGGYATGSKFLLGPGKIQLHHIFPQKWEAWFRAPGRNIDIHEFTVHLESATHLAGVHGKGGFVGPGNVLLPGHWNQRWEEFIAQNPNATAKEIYQFAGRLMDEFGLNGLPLVRYPR